MLSSSLDAGLWPGVSGALVEACNQRRSDQKIRLSAILQRDAIRVHLHNAHLVISAVEPDWRRHVQPQQYTLCQQQGVLGPITFPDLGWLRMEVVVSQPDLRRDGRQHALLILGESQVWDGACTREASVPTPEDDLQGSRLQHVGACAPSAKGDPLGLRH